MAGPLVNPDLGPFFVGNLLSSVLFGVITVQTHLYYSKFPRDSRWLKVLVAFLWFAQLLVVYVVPTSSDYLLLRILTIYTLVSAAVVQSFFVYRLWTLSRQRILTIMIGIVILVNAEFNTVSIASGGVTSNSLSTVTAIASLGVVIDVALTLGIAVTLRKQRTGFRDTDRILNWIIIYVGATGAMISILAVLMLIFIHLKNAWGSFVISVPYGGVHIICVLTHLHARSTLRTRFITREQPVSRSYGPTRSHLHPDWSPSAVGVTRSTVSITLTTNNPSAGDVIELNGHSSTTEVVEIKRTVETIRQSSLVAPLIALDPHHYILGPPIFTSAASPLNPGYDVWVNPASDLGRTRRPPRHSPTHPPPVSALRKCLRKGAGR
ncbi:hypothetical protein DL93DRAFT_2097062 [Clavulina sp. PMI_390]|nr:hypothetical protein DL93DRAFT_2097062 [Clavulina sp. PMI_390]